MKRATAHKIATEAASIALDRRDLQERPYPLTYSVLTVHFEESGGDAPNALAIPYQPFDNRTDVNITGYKLAKVEEAA